MRRSVAAFLILLFTSPVGVAAVAPPPPAPPREVTVPQPAERTLANGLRVIVVQKKGVPLVSARLLVKSGAEQDPPGLEGLAQATATVLTKGTPTRSAEQIARGVEALGATMESAGNWDYSNVDLSVLSTRFAQAMDFLADSVKNATFAEQEVEREREMGLDALSVAMEQPRSLASFVASRVMFGSGPYGHYAGGTVASLQAIKRSDIVSFHRAHYRPENAVLIIGGDITPQTAFTLAEKLFGTWKRSSTAASSTAVKADLPAPRVVVVDMPEAGQAAVVIARPGLKRVDKQFFSAIVANSVLGGGYSSRLNQEIRIKRGLSYGAGSSFELRREVGPFIARAETKNESAAEVASIMIDELHRLGADHVPENELTPRKAVLIGGFGRSLETSGGLVERLATLALYDLDLSEINRFVSGVQGVNADALQQFAKSQLAGDLSVVIVGDAKKFIDSLKKRFPSAEVIPLETLDLSVPTLRKVSEK